MGFTMYFGRETNHLVQLEEIEFVKNTVRTLLKPSSRAALMEKEPASCRHEKTARSHPGGPYPFAGIRHPAGGPLCSKGIGIWSCAGNDQGSEPDVVLACADDVPTMEALAAAALLRENFQDLKIRFVNVVDLFKMEPETEHFHGLSDRDFDSLFTVDKPEFAAWKWPYSRNGD